MRGYLSPYDPTREYEMMAQAALDFFAILSSLTTAPAEAFWFSARRGQLAPGFDADTVVIGERQSGISTRSGRFGSPSTRTDSISHACSRAP